VFDVFDSHVTRFEPSTTAPKRAIKFRVEINSDKNSRTQEIRSTKRPLCATVEVYTCRLHVSVNCHVRCDDRTWNYVTEMCLFGERFGLVSVLD